jgi:hypothetical protein
MMGDFANMMTYSLSEIRNGTGFPKGARFALVPEAAPTAEHGPDWVYRGNPDLVHVPDGARAGVGSRVANDISLRMRDIGGGWTDDRPLCPGCYMVVLFNAAVTLAKQNGQSLKELGRSMACAFDALSIGGPEAIESIQVKLDSEGDACELVSKGNG